MDFVGASESNRRATVLQTILENIAVSGLHSCRMIAVHQDHPIRRLVVSLKLYNLLQATCCWSGVWFEQTTDKENCCKRCDTPQQVYCSTDWATRFIYGGIYFHSLPQGTSDKNPPIARSRTWRSYAATHTVLPLHHDGIGNRSWKEKKGWV